MSGFSFALMILALAAVLATLVIGLVSMAKGGAFNKKYGNKLMQARVFLQATALVLFVIALVSARK